MTYFLIFYSLIVWHLIEQGIYFFLYDLHSTIKEAVVYYISHERRKVLVVQCCQKVKPSGNPVGQEYNFSSSLGIGLRA